MTWRRKNIRLESEAYQGSNAYLITVATEGRVSRFTDAGIVAMGVEGLEASGALEGVEVFAYVFMPDHCHLLLLGSDDSHLASFMKRFKQVSSFRHKQATGETLWQKSYHDHILRREEDLEDVAAYIARNPVRAGLVDDWDDYPYTGGSAFDGARPGDLKVAATRRIPSLDRGGEE